MLVVVVIKGHARTHCDLGSHFTLLATASSISDLLAIPVVLGRENIINGLLGLLLINMHLNELAHVILNAFQVDQKRLIEGRLGHGVELLVLLQQRTGGGHVCNGTARSSGRCYALRLAVTVQLTVARSELL